jgi:hypothetical protein
VSHCNNTQVRPEINPAIDAVLSLFLSVWWAIGTAFNTSSKGPLNTASNGYFGTWSVEPNAHVATAVVRCCCLLLLSAAVVCCCCPLLLSAVVRCCCLLLSAAAISFYTAAPLFFLSFSFFHFRFVFTLLPPVYCE